MTFQRRRDDLELDRKLLWVTLVTITLSGVKAGMWLLAYMLPVVSEPT